MLEADQSYLCENSPTMLVLEGMTRRQLFAANRDRAIAALAQEYECGKATVWRVIQGP